MIHNVRPRERNRAIINVRSPSLQWDVGPVEVDCTAQFSVFHGENLSELLGAKSCDPPRDPFSLDPKKLVAATSMSIIDEKGTLRKHRLEWGKIRLQIVDEVGRFIEWEPIVAFTDAKTKYHRLGLADALIYLMPKFRLEENVIEFEATKSFPGKILPPH